VDLTYGVTVTSGYAKYKVNRDSANRNKKENIYCEILINRGVLIFVDFVVHLNYTN
jgi:hypothetical protein